MAIEASHRPECIRLSHPDCGSATIRDQKPMSDAGLARCLQDGMTPQDWYQLLNGKVFFWANKQRLLKLLTGKAYRQLEHDVLQVDTQALVATHRAAIMLSPINSGATFNLGPKPRGPKTFRSIAEYDYASRRNRMRPADCVVELTVSYAVTDIRQFVRKVERVGPSGRTAIFEAAA